MSDQIHDLQIIQLLDPNGFPFRNRPSDIKPLKCAVRVASIELPRIAPVTAVPLSSSWPAPEILLLALLTTITSSSNEAQSFLLVRQHCVLVSVLLTTISAEPLHPFAPPTNFASMICRFLPYPWLHHPWNPFRSQKTNMFTNIFNSPPEPSQSLPVRSSLAQLLMLSSAEDLMCIYNPGCSIGFFSSPLHLPRSSWPHTIFASE